MFRWVVLAISISSLLTTTALGFSVSIGPIRVDSEDGVTVDVPGGGGINVGPSGVSVKPPELPDLTEAVAPVLNIAKQAGDTVLEGAVRNAASLIENVENETKKAVEDVLNTADKAVRDTASTLVKTADDTVEAAEAIGRYAEREVQGWKTTLTDAEQRFREGKVVDAMWHLATDPAKHTEQNAAQLAQENAWVALAMQSAASVYGGPAGSAAFAAWMTYHQTGGNFELALKAGVVAYASASGYANVNAMPTGTMGELLKKSAVAGAVGGMSVAASGGTTEASLNAFVKSGGAVLVQAGQAYVNEKYVDPAKAEAQSYLDRAKAQADAFCMTAVDRSCAEAAEWVQNAREDVEAVKQMVRSKPTVVASADGEWAISWNNETSSSPSMDVPSIALTYVGEGSAVRDTLNEIAALTPEEAAEQNWVAFEDVGATKPFFGLVDGRQVYEEPAPGQTLVARTDINIRARPAAWEAKTDLLQRSSVVTVLEVKSLTAANTAQKWIRVFRPEQTAPSLGWIYLGRALADGSWEQPRSRDLLNAVPEELAGRTITLDYDVNVRSDMFRSDGTDCFYEDTEIVGAFPAGRQVVLDWVERFPVCDTYIWARVR